MKKICLLIFVALYLERASAGLQILTSNIIQGFAKPITNRVVTKMETNSMRIDTDASMTTIVLPNAGGDIQLFHQAKTYRWLANDPSSETNSLAPIAVSAGETILNDSPAQLFCWTNGPDHGRIWIVTSEKFLKSGTNKFVANKSASVLTANLGVGSLFNTNFIIAQTERTSLNPVSMPAMPGANISGTVFTNVMITQTSSLISITETNFSPTEFALPSDYQDAATQPPPQNQINPAALGRGPIGGNLDNLRKEYEKGRPMLAPIPYAH